MLVLKCIVTFIGLIVLVATVDSRKFWQKKEGKIQIHWGNLIEAVLFLLAITCCILLMIMDRSNPFWIGIEVILIAFCIALFKIEDVETPNV